jgi:hypothetical protein
MHAYAHEWVCQLSYNTRLQRGMGMTDGEGDERHWAKNRHLIGITRSCGVCDSVFQFLYYTWMIIFRQECAYFYWIEKQPL